MIKDILKKFIGTYHERERKRLWPIVEQINVFEPEIQKLNDSELKAKTDTFKKYIQEKMSAHKFLDPSQPEWYNLTGDDRVAIRKKRRKIQQKILDEILPEAFAVVREASVRTLGMRHFDVQLFGGMILNEGKIAEMATGEGKTLVATLPAYLNSLTGRSVHIVTVNDYLARRDTRWMGPIFEMLGLSVGAIQGVDPGERKPGEESLSFIYDPTVITKDDRFNHLRKVNRFDAYRVNILYGQNNELGFDYLRDNMRFQQGQSTQGDFHYAIVDEVDSILIDEARTPLIISGPAEESTELYLRLDKLVPKMTSETHFEIDEKAHSVSLTEEGILQAEKLLGIDNLYDEMNMRQVHHINQALRAHHLFKADVDYVVKNNEIIIVDEFTGRLMPGRRWSDGLHQAIEAKENVRICEENQTLASVTFQNFFRMYEKLSGMTGTAQTEAMEFKQIYDLDVVVVPTNRPLVRLNQPDTIFKTEDEKFITVILEIAELHRKGQPVLIGTISIDRSELLSRMLKDPGPLNKRLSMLAEWTAEDLKKETVTEDLRKSIEHIISRPAMVSEQEVSDVFASVKAKLPNSMLAFRFEDMLRLVQTITMVREGIPHYVLNAKQHENEARIVAQAGRKGAITIATNMAGRGTDILLGGNPQALSADKIREEEKQRGADLDEAEKKKILDEFVTVCALEHDEVIRQGGLHVLGTERHEARRIDNQLRGRSGRQGDPGSSHFYLSLADDLMRVFGVDLINKMMDMKWFKWEEGMPIEHAMISRAIETAQRRVEGHNFDIRKQLLEYDNTMNRQREVIYEQRHRILDGIDLQGLVREIIAEVSENFINTFTSKNSESDEWDLKGLCDAMNRQFAVALSEEGLPQDRELLQERLDDVFDQAYVAKRQEVGEESIAHLERTVLLSVMDGKWKDHLYMMDALREGIGLRAYGQRDPVVEYQREAYRMFQEMIGTIKVESLMMLLRVKPVTQQQQAGVFEKTPHQEMHPEVANRFAPKPQVPGESRPTPTADPNLSLPAAPKASTAAPTQYSGPKVGRNDPCPCGSGKKFKKCHGG